MFRLAPSSDISERDLVERCLSVTDQATRRQAQQQLYERHKRAMFSTAYQITNVSLYPLSGRPRGLNKA